jgi:Fe-Mn family superoxide dismutase
MPFDLPYLPFSKDELEPHISTRTIEFHHGKHHQAYVNNLNGLIKDSPLAEKTLEEIILISAKDETKGRDFQQRSAGLESHLFLEQPEACRRRAATRIVGFRSFKGFWQRRSF